MNKTVRTRIAPSPTGEDIHIGNLYTAYLSYIYAKKFAGQFIVRVEDTDRERLVTGSEERILQTLTQYGILADESPLIGGEYSPYRQSDRLPIYKEYVDKLIENQTAYYCVCTKERLDDLRTKLQLEKKNTRYDKHCLTMQDEVKKQVLGGASFVIRMNIPLNEEISFTDVIRGEITFNTNDLDDQVLLKSDGYPTYHLAVVVDDYLMKITHILRGEDWIPSTPKHILLYRSFGWELPVFCHVPLLRNPDKTKLSKRKNPVWSHWYLEQGYLPEAMLNFLVLMGWSHPEGKEIFTQEEFMNYFDLKDLKSVGPAFDVVKLRWMNQQYIMNLTPTELKQQLRVFDPELNSLDDTLFDAIIPLVQTRLETLSDFKVATKHFFVDVDTTPRNEKEKDVAIALVKALKEITIWKKEEILAVARSIMSQYTVRMPTLYYLLTGEERGLPLPETLEILGKEKTIERVNN